jgi:hypothetical protein
VGLCPVEHAADFVSVSRPAVDLSACDSAVARPVNPTWFQFVVNAKIRCRNVMADSVGAAGTLDDDGTDD